MLSVFVAIEAKHGDILQSNEPLAGYCQTLGVTARDHKELVQLVRDFIYKDLESTLVDIFEMWLPDFEGCDADKEDTCGDMKAVGIWFYSGRAFFGDEDEDEDEEDEVEEGEEN